MTGQDIKKRYEAMDQHYRGNWMNMFQECADWAMPTNDNVNRIRVQGTEKPPQRMIDTCIEALFKFATGFFSHMFPPNTIWAKYRHPSPSMMDIPEVADYFERVSRIIHSEMVASNFAQEEFAALKGIGCFGTSALQVDSGKETTLKFKNYMVPVVRVEENYDGVVDTVGREFEYTARQAVQKWGRDVLEKANLMSLISDFDANKPTKHKFIHFVCPRTDYDVGKLTSTNKPIASFYVHFETGTIVSEGGFNYMPYKVARFETGNDEVYGRSPMSMKLATARRTNQIYRSMIVAAEQHSNPQWLIPDDDSVKGLSGRAGALIKWRATNPNGRPERLAPNGDPGIAHDMYQLHEQEIRTAFFNDLFRTLDDYRNMTATEVNERVATDLMALAPFAARYIHEKINPVMEQVYYICQKKKGLLPPLPAILAEAPEFSIDYVGKLALATKNFEVSGALSTISVFAELAQSIPLLQSAFDNLEIDKLFRDVWFAKSSSMNALKDPAMVEGERAARAEQAAMQQQQEQIPAMADAAQKLSGEVQPNSILSKMAGE